MAQRGYSRDQRSDCQQVCIGLVVSRCGMPLGYEVFPGNTADVSTVEKVRATRMMRPGQTASPLTGPHQTRISSSSAAAQIA